MFASVAALGVSVSLEAWAARHFETSISAYWYTPVRPVFVGALVMIGVALMVIRGTPREDFMLTIAGACALVVAFVPTNPSGVDRLEDAVLELVDNNLKALFFVAAAVLAVAAAWRKRRRSQPFPEDSQRIARQQVAVGVLLLITLLLFVAMPNVFIRYAHSAAAIAMFLSLAGAAAFVSSAHGSNNGLYLGIAMAMAGIAFIAIFLGITGFAWSHYILHAEVIELALFCGFWYSHTWELHSSISRTGTAETAVAHRESTLGSTHPHTVYARAGLAASSRDAGYTTEAIKLGKDVVDYYTKEYDPDHPNTISAQRDLAASYWQADMHEKAHALDKHVADYYIQHYGRHHPDTIDAQAALAASYRDVGDTTRAIELGKRVVDYYTKKYGPDHPDTADAQADLAASHEAKQWDDDMRDTNPVQASPD